MSFSPHTDADIREMLSAIGVLSIDDLFDEIPQTLRAAPLNLPDGMNEMEVARTVRSLALRNRPLVCFAGAGAYDHHIPAAVWEIAQRGEFYSAYTPYQPEASQGTLQVLYEYQTMMASLTGMDVSNASLYDGASALAEAILMALRANPRSRRVLIPATVNPVYRHVVKTLVGNQGIELITLPFNPASGRIDPALLEAYADGSVSALVIPQPNFFGMLEDVDTLTDWCSREGALAIGLVNPVAMALLAPPGEWGADGAAIACGDGQPLGAPLSGGGPYFGFLCCRKQWVHQLPGRLVGATVDHDGKPGYTLTLQAREQHIRRGKATSNICTNQGLMATAATIHMAILGPEGLRRVALHCHENTRKLRDRLTAIAGVKPAFSGPFFHETVLELSVPAHPVLTRLAERGILGGYDLSDEFPELGPALLVCATEMRTHAEIEAYAQALETSL
ncbi:MAG: glycine cleavage system protein (pyridoxal-binding), N-terminal domain protein [Proteobacteria bacterium]|nr:glycine cleavage system protein (pyridoxal-binding), N-terminal domain protein [Pseudomonadota bacterium]